jgi:hypothetical protein
MRKSLSDILRADQGRLQDAWENAKAADDFGTPLPAGEYVARIVSGELFNSKTKGTGGYKLAFRILEGDHKGRQFWHDIWLTEAALPTAKRDLAKLGVTRLDQLETPLPEGIRCKVKLALRKEDDGSEYNRLRTFEVIGIDPPEVDPFAPQDNPHPDPLPEGEGTRAESPLPKGEETQPQAADGSAGGNDERF